MALLIGAVILSVGLTLYKNTQSPPCQNADEAAFAYNAYSIAKTGADEYGTFLPARLKSFGDYKMPLFTYLTVPAVAVFGLNDWSGLSVNIVLSALLPVLIYAFAKELFRDTWVGITASFLIAGSLGIHIISRHTHEALLSAFLTTFCAYLLLRFFRFSSVLSGAVFIGGLILLLFSYHPGRIFAGFFFLCIVIVLLSSQKKRVVSRKRLFFLGVATLMVVIGFLITDIRYSPDRIKNLFFINDTGFSLRINELRGEGGSRIMYNKATLGAREIMVRHLAYYAPAFLAADGDGNFRFGYPGMAPVSLIVYGFIWIGVYYVFKHALPYRWYLAGLAFIAPLSGSLSWADVSISRSLFLFVPLYLFAAYGFVHFLNLYRNQRVRIVVVFLIILFHSIFLWYSWDFYLNHYPKRAGVLRSWQCGYKELVSYIESVYPQVERFYITRKNGEPYIFLLYFQSYPPELYQPQAQLTEPDEYGFGQVEQFDKFEFSFQLPVSGSYVAIGYPDDFIGAPEAVVQSVQKIVVGTEEIFWVYRSQK